MSTVSCDPVTYIAPRDRQMFAWSHDRVRVSGDDVLEQLVLGVPAEVLQCVRCSLEQDV